MCAPRKALAIQLVKIQSEERVATTSELNSAPSLVTNCREARGMGCWAVTQVKGLSPEINHRFGSRYSTFSRRQNSHNRYMRGCASPTGSETIARYQKESKETRETQSVLRRGVCSSKSINDKVLQKTHWESDWRIVVKRQGNACGAKALAGELLEQGNFLQTRDWIKKDNKTVSKTYNGEVLQKSRVREILKHGSVRGLIHSVPI